MTSARIFLFASSLFLTREQVQGYDLFSFMIDGNSLSEHAQDCIKETDDFLSADDKLTEVTHDFFIVGSLSDSSSTEILSGLSTTESTISYTQEAVDEYQHACEEEGGKFVKNCLVRQTRMNNLVMKNMALCLASTESCQKFVEELLDNDDGGLGPIGIQCSGSSLTSLLPDDASSTILDEWPNYDLHGGVGFGGHKTDTETLEELPNYDFHEGMGSESNHQKHNTGPATTEEVPNYDFHGGVGLGGSSPQKHSTGLETTKELPNYDFHGAGIGSTRPKKVITKNPPTPHVNGNKLGLTSSKMKVLELIVAIFGVFIILGAHYFFADKKQKNGVNESDGKVASNV